MRVSVTDAKAQLTDLVRRAEAGDEIVLTRHGHDAVRLVAATQPSDTPEERLRFLQELSRKAAAKALPGPSAARSQDFLYGEDGLPE